VLGIGNLAHGRLQLAIDIAGLIVELRFRSWIRAIPKDGFEYEQVHLRSILSVCSNLRS